MFKVTISLAIFLAVAQGAPNGNSTYCGSIPVKIYQCLNYPMVVSNQVSNKCYQFNSECDKMTCVFRKSNWMDGTTLKKQNIKLFFDQYAEEHPEWTQAVQQIKEECLGADLPPQGVHLNCPAYDVVSCALSCFFRYATPSQWSTSEECRYPRAYAAACPTCPDDCFSLQVPIGSCNACTRLPRPQTP